jgi:hypothetical protein
MLRTEFRLPVSAIVERNGHQKLTFAARRWQGIEF